MAGNDGPPSASSWAMRSFSSIVSSMVSLLVVTASFTLAGCAADAEFPSEEGQPNVALSDPNAKVPERDKTKDIGDTAKVSDSYATPSPAIKARLVPGEVDPRLVNRPSGFEHGSDREPETTPFVHAP
jgi:hypothetical protein